MTNFENLRKRLLEGESVSLVEIFEGPVTIKFDVNMTARDLADSLTDSFMAWANKDAEEEMKYIVRCELDVGACMFSSFWNGRTFEKGEENAKVFHGRESAEEELNRFGYSPSDYSILKTTEL